jgi:hypothetical protein
MPDVSKNDDALFEILLNAIQEIWILKDRQLVLERVLQDSGIDVCEAVERFQPDADFESELSQERKRFLDTVLAPVNREE